MTEIFGEYKLSFLKGDLIGGISVAAISLPVGVAYAEIVHLPPESGIYTAIFAFLCYFFLGSSKETIIGPDSVAATLFATAVFAVSAGNSELTLQLMVLITITTGILMFAAGFLKLGFISNFLSKPILTGYINGIALILIIGQLGKFTGLKLSGVNPIMELWDLFVKFEFIHLPTILTGLASLAVLTGLKKISSKIPSQLILLVMSVIFARVFNFGGYGIKLTQEILNAFPVFVLPNVNVFMNHYADILAASAAILFVSYTGEIPVARTFSKDKHALNPNREFFALGLADIVIGFFKGYPIGGASSRSAVNAVVGGKTKMVNIIAALVMFLVIVFLSKEFALIPSVVFGAIIIDAASGMFKIKDLYGIRKFSVKEYRVGMVCMAGVVLIGVYQGIVLALVLSFIQLIARNSKPLEYELVYDEEKDFTEALSEENKHLLRSDALLYRYNASLVFFNADNFREKILEKVNGKTELKVVILDARPINYIDLTGLDNLIDVIKEINEKNVKIIFAGIKEKYRIMLSERFKSHNLDTDVFYPNVRSYFKK
jgi:high affinity sulfate transporter 1